MSHRFKIWYPGAKYHITSRGVRKSTLFYDDKDYKKYLNLLLEAKERYPFILHTYCLMTNHVHLQIETIQHPPGAIMKHLNMKYAKYFNKRYDFYGHVFQSRYGAELIDTADYELDVSKYIHLNPLKAGMVYQLEDYPWSSYLTYVKNKEDPLITTSQILSYFIKPQRLNYEKYLKASYQDHSIYLINPTLATLKTKP